MTPAERIHELRNAVCEAIDHIIRDASSEPTALTATALRIAVDLAILADRLRAWMDDPLKDGRDVRGH